jgi:hypothetical protein
MKHNEKKLSQFIKYILFFFKKERVKLFLYSLLVYIFLDLIFWFLSNKANPPCNQMLCEVRNINFWVIGYDILNIGLYLSIILLFKNHLMILVGKIISFVLFFLIILFLNFLRKKIWK